jgi:hypothetical protein
MMRPTLAIVLLIAALQAAETARLELPALLWGASKRPDGTYRYWAPEPLIKLGATLVSVAYRPLDANGKQVNVVGLIPPKTLAKLLETTKPELKESHAHGIRVMGYADSIFFHKGMLEAEGISTSDLYALDRDHKPVQNFSWDKAGVFVSCVRNPGWLKLQQEVADVTAKAGFDGLQFDVYPYAVKPSYYCQCEHCQRGWKEYSSKRFGAAHPMPGRTADELNFTNVDDRAFYEWRLQSFVDFVKALQAYSARKHPGFPIIMNHGSGNSNFMFEAYQGALEQPSSELWHLKLGEESSLPLYRMAEGANGSRLLSLFNYRKQIEPAFRYRTAIAESYAGGGMGLHALPVSGAQPDLEEVGLRYFQFLRANADLFTNTHSESGVALLYSWRDQAFLHGDVKKGAAHINDGAYYRGWAQAVAECGIPYDVLMIEKGLTLERLRRYQAVIAPELYLVDDSDARVLEQYVKKGGRLLAIGDLGQQRTVARGEFVKRSPSLLQTWKRDTDQSWHMNLGSGLVSFVPASAAKGQGPRNPSLLAAVNAADLRSQLKVEGAGPLEATIRGKDQRRMIHLIRLGSDEKASDMAVSVDYRVPPGSQVESVRLVSPDTHSELEWKDNRDSIHINVKRLETWTVLAVTLK